MVEIGKRICFDEAVQHGTFPQAHTPRHDVLCGTEVLNFVTRMKFTGSSISTQCQRWKLYQQILEDVHVLSESQRLEEGWSWDEAFFMRLLERALESDDRFSIARVAGVTNALRKQSVSGRAQTKDASRRRSKMMSFEEFINRCWHAIEGDRPSWLAVVHMSYALSKYDASKLQNLDLVSAQTVFQ